MSNLINLENKKILLRMPNWIGDFVMATPLISDIKNNFPSCHLSILCPKAFAGLAKSDPLVNEVIVGQSLRGILPNQGKRDVINYCKSKGFDLSILTTNSFSSALHAWRMNIPYRVGFKNEGREIFLSHPLFYPKNKQKQHLVKTYKKLLTPLGIEESLTKPYLKVSNESLSWVKDFLKTYDVDVDKHILIGVNPGAAYGSAKCWPKERFAKVAEYLSSFENVRVLFFAPPDQKSMIDDICAEQNKRVLNLAGKTNLEQLLGMIKTSDIMLSNDSGPMHLSYALETPVVAIFGSTNEVATGPYCLGRVIHKHVSCSPCYLRKCPVDFRCMKAISVEEVCQNLKNFLKEHSSKVF
jgi:heptosyltransferase II